MIRLRRPGPQTLRRFLDSQAVLPFGYPGVGSTAGVTPPGYSVDHTRVRLGQGEQTFAAARAALARWEQFRLGWVEPWPGDTPLQPGAAVAVVAHIMGMWWVNPARIVYVVDRPGPPAAFGFAYGTLPGHVEKGEERFLVEWDPQDGGVFYDLLAFSKPRHLMARLGWPVSRHIQKRFARDSAAAMQRAVNATAR
jgi:uncharacterized protein (UPF0548 family)